MKNIKFMDSSKYIKIIFLLTIGAIVGVVGCKGGKESEESSRAGELTDYVNQPELAILGIPSICENGPAEISGHVTDQNSGQGIANVKISVNGCIAKTDNNGFYLLPNLNVKKKAMITFSHEGYCDNSTAIQIRHYSADTTALSPNYLEYAISAYDFQDTYSAQDDKILRADKNANVYIPASTYIDTAGNNYRGKVTSRIAYEDVLTDKGKNAFVGTYEGRSINGTITQFVSYGFIAIDITDENGTKLDLTDTAVITFPYVKGATAENIPLWYYNYPEGIWIEDGSAVRQANGTYKGEISHPGAWGLNMPLESIPGIYRGRITYRDGTAAKDIRVYAIGPNWINSDLSTDADGNFEIKVIPNSSFYLKAYNYKYKYEAWYKDEDGNYLSIPPVASGEITER